MRRFCRSPPAGGSSTTGDPDFKLKKSLTALDLTVFGIGVIIGAGIFTLTGLAAKDYAASRSAAPSQWWPRSRPSESSRRW
jgi:hypothetical protein